MALAVVLHCVPSARMLPGLLNVKKSFKNVFIQFISWELIFQKTGFKINSVPFFGTTFALLHNFVKFVYANFFDTANLYIVN